MEEEPIGYSSPSEAFVFLSFLLKVIYQLDLPAQDLCNLQALKLAGVDTKFGWDEAFYSGCVSSVKDRLLSCAHSRRCYC